MSSTGEFSLYNTPSCPGSLFRLSVTLFYKIKGGNKLLLMPGFIIMETAFKLINISQQRNITAKLKLSIGLNWV